MKIYKYILVCLSILMLASCADEKLTELNPNNEDSSNFFTNLKETQLGLNAAYSAMLAYNATLIREQTIRADMGWPGATRPNPSTLTRGDVFYTHTYNASTPEVDFHWNALYRGVLRANIVIEALEKLQGTVDEVTWKQQMGEARFLRGIFYFYLHTTYNGGSIVLQKSVPKTAGDYTLPLSPASEVLEFFRADLKYAYDNLSGDRNNGRANKVTAATILGTSHLYQNEFDLASGYFSTVIANPNYSIVTDLTKMFTTKGEHNAESIFELTYDTNLRPDITNAFDEQSLTNRLSFLSSNFGNLFAVPAWLAWEYKNEAKDPKVAANHIDGNLSKPLRNVPLRASAMVTLVEDEQTAYYGSTVTVKGVFSPTAGPSRYKKYVNFDIYTDINETDNPTGSSLKSGKNVTLNRLADVYLMQAECLITKGDAASITEALRLINIIRARWGLQLLGPVVDATRTYLNDGKNYTNPTILMSHLKNIEKPLELSAEGYAIRFNDLRRWGMLKSNFQDLATRKYYLNAFDRGATGFTPRYRFGAAITKVKSTQANPTAGPDFQSEITNEYVGASANFNAANHNYFPIPSTEIANNPNLNSK